MVRSLRFLVAAAVALLVVGLTAFVARHPENDVTLVALVLFTAFGLALWLGRASAKWAMSLDDAALERYGPKPYAR